jgi:hypothetical protein
MVWTESWRAESFCYALGDGPGEWASTLMILSLMILPESEGQPMVWTESWRAESFCYALGDGPGEWASTLMILSLMILPESEGQPWCGQNHGGQNHSAIPWRTGRENEPLRL